MGSFVRMEGSLLRTKFTRKGCVAFYLVTLPVKFARKEKLSTNLDYFL